VTRCPPALRYLADDLAALDRSGLLRRRSALPRETLSFCSNDYLGLADRACTGLAGAGASRLVSGERAEHAALEHAVAEWLGLDAALVFSSGYSANVGTLSALAQPGDLIVSDTLNHASLIDGARLSRAKIVRVPHNDADAVARVLAQHKGRRSWVVTESYFSMDADGPNLQRLRSVCDEHDAGLYVDEAHALGVLGPSGRGRCAEASVVPDVLVGTFGKAFGAGGAFVAGCADLVTWLWNRARTFVFSTGLSPVVALAALEGLQIAIQEPQRRERALAAAQAVRDGLRARVCVPLGWGHIIPLLVGGAEQALAISDQLSEHGIHVAAIRPPSVPTDAARLRMTVTARHTTVEVDRALAAIEHAWPR
jgi:8-amino-7-oxononanoate synthase